MPDSQQPPFWGPPRHERDLEALLSGEPGNTPTALRPVESTLAALRAAPTRRELSAEADARAAFRALAPWPAPAEHETASADTLVLPLGEHLLPPADRRPPRAARHRRRRRRVSGAGRRPAIALTIAAAAVVVIAVAVTGAIPGSIGQVSFGSHPASARPSTPRAGQPRGLLDGAGHPSRQSRRSPSPQVSVTPSARPGATTAPGTLCRELFEFSGQQSRETKVALFEALTRAAGGSSKVIGYCLHLLGPSFSIPSLRALPTFSFGDFPGGPGDRGSGGHPGAAKPGPGSPGAANIGAAKPGPANPAPGNPGNAEAGIRAAR